MNEVSILMSNITTKFNFFNASLNLSNFCCCFVSNKIHVAYTASNFILDTFIPLPPSQVGHLMRLIGSICSVSDGEGAPWQEIWHITSEWFQAKWQQIIIALISLLHQLLPSFPCGKSKGANRKFIQGKGRLPLRTEWPLYSHNLQEYDVGSKMFSYNSWVYGFVFVCLIRYHIQISLASAKLTS